MKYLILLMVMFVQLFSAQNLEKVTLQLQWYHQFQFAGYYMAKEKGFYEDVGLDVELKEYSSNINPVDQVISKKVNYATGRSSLIIDASKGKNVVALAAILQSSPLVLIARSDSGIHRIEDLNGKRVGGDHTTVNAVSILSMLEKKNVILNYTPGDNTKNDIENLLDKNVDAIAAYMTNEIYTLNQTNLKYIVFNPKNYKFNFYSDILFSSEDEVTIHPQRTRNFKNASLKGWEYAFSHIDETVQLILDKYNTQNKTREALTFEAYKLSELAYFKTDQIGKIDDNKIKNIYNIYKNLGLIEKSIDLNRFILQEDHALPVIFTKEETAYLKQKKEITVCGRKDWLPYTNFAEKKARGLVPELIDEYSNIIGIPIKYMKTNNFHECVEKTKNREIDVVDVILKNPNTWQHLTPSNTHTSDFLVLVTKVEKPYINNIADADNMSVAVVGTYKSMIHYIKKQYPNLNLRYVKNLSEGLKQVSKGQVDAYIGVFMPTTFMINKQYTKALKINSRFSQLELDGAFGIRSDEPLLLSIFNKAIDALDPIKKREIIHSWIGSKQEKEFDYSLFLKILYFIIVLLLILAYRQYILKRENKRLEKAYKMLQYQKRELKEQKKIYELIFDSAMDGILILDNGKFTDCNQSIVKMLKYDKKEDLLNMHPAQLSPERQPDGRHSFEKADEMIALAYKNRGCRFEWVHMKATGENFWAEIILTPIFLDNREILHVVWRDISERKKLESENAAIKERMELAFTGSQDGLWDWNLVDNSVYFSARWKEILGYNNELVNCFDTCRANSRVGTRISTSVPALSKPES